MALSTQRASSSFTPSSSSSSIPQLNYDVFLSFRGQDTRTSFTDHLYHALQRAGIWTFRDDRELPRGEVIQQGLLKAIEESRFSIIIFSKTYASSKWCLDELVKIVECKNKMGQKVVPVFYDVDPSKVRNQKGYFQEAFAKHEEDFRDNQEKVRRWRIAMREVGEISGFPLQNRHESEFIQDIVKYISSKLSLTFSGIVNEFVGMDSRLWNLRLNIDLGLKDVRFVGIYGIGGIGKTTLATVFFSQMSCHFEGSSFLANVREVSKEGRLVSLQENLLSQILVGSSFQIRDVYHGIDMIRSRLRYKKVLVVIDDVDHINQLEVLAGNRDWFGLGSIIIITTRDEHLLSAHEVNVVYKAKGLDDGEALQLFSLKAFKKYHPSIDYMELSRHVVRYADGLPLALKVFGSFLSGRSIDVWKSALERLKDDPGKEIVDRLQISFDGLEETDKKIFLDVAYFFKGKDRDYVTKILDSCQFYPQIGIEVLIGKCLITISHDNKLCMHDLLQQMAKKIVQEESSKELGKRSRLQGKEEVYHVLTKNLGTEAAVEGISHNFSEQEEVALSAKAFSNMDKLRVLQVSNVTLLGGLDYLSNELRFLKWHKYPLKSLPSSFQPDKIVVLNLCYSRIQQLWKGIKQPLNKLKFINLSHSENLTMMPDFTWIPNLESLILEGCTRLLELHPSIGVLKRLITLNLKDCISLSSLPSTIKLESLEICILAGCSKLMKFPEIIGEMEYLKKLDVSGTAIGEFSSSIFLLMKNLEVLSFRGCKGPSYKSWSPIQLLKRRRLDPIPLSLPSLSGLCCLKNLDLSDCNLWEGAIPNDLGGISSLIELNLSNNNIVNLPTSINQLSKLLFLNLSNCKMLKSLSVLFSNMLVINVSNCTSIEILSDAVKPLSGALISLPHAPVQYKHHNSFCGSNCFKLVENESGRNLAFAVMKRSLQEPLYGFELIVPGSEIPKWFSHQSERASTRIGKAALLDSGDDDLLCVVCCVFVFHEDLGLNGIPWIAFSLLRPLDFKCHKYRLADELGKAMSDHLWLLFFPSNITPPSDKNQIDILFETICPHVELKKFGIRFIHKHEVEEFNQTINQCNSSTFEDFNDLHQDLYKLAVDGAKIRKVYDYCSSPSHWDMRYRNFVISITKSGAVWEDFEIPECQK